jgi:membrane protein
VQLKNIWHLLTSAFAAWNEHEAPRLGAALAFYTILSLAPLMVLVEAHTLVDFAPQSHPAGARVIYLAGCFWLARSPNEET